jgi:hypothetical protein
MIALAAASLVALAPGAYAGGAVALTDGQLDHVSAGSAIVSSSADAAATGLKAYANTLSNSALGTNKSVEDGFGSEGGVSSGVAVAWGLNPLGNSNGNGLTTNGTPAPPPTSNTAVTTGGVAQGNFTLTISGAMTSSALGQTIQVGTTSVYGVFVPGL